MVHAVLVVEDEPDIAQAVEFFLRDEGCDVAVAASPAEAFAQIDTHSFDFILTDLFRHPDVEAHIRDPLASARELRRRANPTPVGVMTAWAVPESDAIAQGFACLIHKPFDLNTPLACVANSIQSQLSPEEEQRADSVHAFFAALGAGDISTLERLCTDGVQFLAPRTPIPTSRSTGEWRTWPMRLHVPLHYPACGLRMRVSMAWLMGLRHATRCAGLVQTATS